MNTSIIYLLYTLNFIRASYFAPVIKKARHRPTLQQTGPPIQNSPYTDTMNPKDKYFPTVCPGPSKHSRSHHFEIDQSNFNPEYVSMLHTEFGNAYFVYKNIDLELLDEYFNNLYVKNSIESPYKIFDFFTEGQIAKNDPLEYKSFLSLSYADQKEKVEARQKLKHCLLSMDMPIEDHIRLLIETLYFPYNIDLTGSLTHKYFASNIPGQISAPRPQFKGEEEILQYHKKLHREIISIYIGKETSDDYLKFESKLAKIFLSRHVNFNDSIKSSFDGEEQNLTFCQVTAHLIFSISLKSKLSGQFSFVFGGDVVTVDRRDHRQMVSLLLYLYFTVDYETDETDWFILKNGQFEDLVPHIYDVIEGECKRDLQNLYTDYFESEYQRMFVTNRAEFLKDEMALKHFVYEFNMLPSISDEFGDRDVETILRASIYADLFILVEFPMTELIEIPDGLKQDLEKFTSERIESVYESIYRVDPHKYVIILKAVKDYYRNQMSIIYPVLAWSIYPVSDDDHYKWSPIKTLMLKRGFEWFFNFPLRRAIHGHNVAPLEKEHRGILHRFSRILFFNFHGGPFYENYKFFHHGDYVIENDEQILSHGGADMLIGYIISIGHILDPRNFPIFDDDKLYVNRAGGSEQIREFQKLNKTSHYIVKVEEEIKHYIGDVSENDNTSSDDQSVASVRAFEPLIELPTSDLAINYLLQQYDLDTYEKSSIIYTIWQLKNVCNDRRPVLNEWFSKISRSTSHRPYKAFDVACDNIAKFASSEFFAIYDERIFALKRFKKNVEIERDFDIASSLKVAEETRIKDFKSDFEKKPHAAEINDWKSAQVLENHYPEPAPRTGVDYEGRTLKIEPLKKKV